MNLRDIISYYQERYEASDKSRAIGVVCTTQYGHQITVNPSRGFKHLTGYAGAIEVKDLIGNPIITHDSVHFITCNFFNTDPTLPIREGLA